MISSPALLAEQAEVMEPPPLPRPVCRDQDDDQVLALAIAARAQMIVSGDNDLRSLMIVEDIPILAPAQAAGRIDSGSTG